LIGSFANPSTGHAAAQGPGRRLIAVFARLTWSCHMAWGLFIEVQLHHPCPVKTDAVGLELLISQAGNPLILQLTIIDGCVAICYL